LLLEALEAFAVGFSALGAERAARTFLTSRASRMIST
jgi:hypothetical protein